MAIKLTHCQEKRQKRDKKICQRFTELWPQAQADGLKAWRVMATIGAEAGVDMTAEGVKKVLVKHGIYDSAKKINL